MAWTVWENYYLPVVIFALVTGLVLTLMVQPQILAMISRAGFIRPNYKGELIPAGAGIVFPSTVTLAYLPLLIMLPTDMLPAALLFILLLIQSSFLGLIDDVWGSREVSGLKGHLSCLLRGRLTTGGLKAVGGGVISLLAAVVAGPLTMVPINALVIALSMNTINLLDLRPGRAGKVFLLWAALLAFAGWGSEKLLLLALLSGCLLAYLPHDLKARSMMGDAGSNALGAGLGLLTVWFLELPTKVGVLLLLVAFHLLTEKYSLTQVIAKNKLLNYIDNLGREK